MHRTLKAETAEPPAHTAMEQQRTFDRFRREFNDERPHEALGQKPPAKMYAPSLRPFPKRVCSPEYPSGMIVKHTDKHGRFFWGGTGVHLVNFLAEEPIGLREVGPDEWEVFYGPVQLGWVERRSKKIDFHRTSSTPKRPRLQTIEVQPPR